jgi:hypothetical protein
MLVALSAFASKNGKQVATHLKAQSKCMNINVVGRIPSEKHQGGPNLKPMSKGEGEEA